MAVVALMAISLFNSALADLIFSAPPRGTEAKERATYEPLAKAMSGVLGETVVYEYPRDFIQYSVEMQKGHYDIVFDGPHFSQWRVQNLKHQLLVNLPENLQFFVVAGSQNSHIKNLRDLLYQKVCAQLTPQLGTLMLLQNYYEHAVEPRMHLVRGEDKVFTDFEKGQCAAAVLRDKTYYKLSAEQQRKYKIIYKSNVAPNDAITVNAKLDAGKRKALIDLLTDSSKMQVAEAIFSRFSNNATAFNKLDPKQYDGLDQLLLMAFGWDIGNTAIRADRDRVETSAVLGMN